MKKRVDSGSLFEVQEKRQHRNIIQFTNDEII